MSVFRITNYFLMSSLLEAERHRSTRTPTHINPKHHSRKCERTNLARLVGILVKRGPHADVTLVDASAEHDVCGVLTKGWDYVLFERDRSSNIHLQPAVMFATRYQQKVIG